MNQPKRKIYYSTLKGIDHGAIQEVQMGVGDVVIEDNHVPLVAQLISGMLRDDKFLHFIPSSRESFQAGKERQALFEEDSIEVSGADLRRLAIHFFQSTAGMPSGDQFLRTAVWSIIEKYVARLAVQHGLAPDASSTPIEYKDDDLAYFRPPV
jgi:hypothetical protein